MRALIWKELRENFKWALLAAAVLGAAEMHALYSVSNGEPDFYEYSNEGITLCKPSFLVVTAFGCIAAGALLGLLQILPELKRDRWAALLHRPASRGVVFRGKVTAGLLLYAVATVPPFLLAVWLAATPGHFGAPFLPKMASPGAADICTGAVYYLAAVAAALQRGIVLRVLPFLAAIYTSIFVLNIPLFNVAVEAAALMALALLVAGWGIIHNQESLRARPWLGKVAFLAVVFYGVCCVGGIALSLFHVAARASHLTTNEYQFTDNNVPLRLTSIDYVVVSVHDLKGAPVTDPKYQPGRVRNSLRILNSFTDYIGDAHGWRPHVYQDSYRESRAYLWAAYPYQYPRLEQWFEVSQPHYLIGYLPFRKTPFEILDRLGFRPVHGTPPKPEGFPADMEVGGGPEESYCIWTPGSARFAYLRTRKMVDLALPVPGPIQGVEDFSARSREFQHHVYSPRSSQRDSPLRQECGPGRDPPLPPGCGSMGLARARAEREGGSIPPSVRAERLDRGQDQKKHAFLRRGNECVRPNPEHLHAPSAFQPAPSTHLGWFRLPTAADPRFFLWHDALQADRRETGLRKAAARPGERVRPGPRPHAGDQPLRRGALPPAFGRNALLGAPRFLPLGTRVRVGRVRPRVQPCGVHHVPAGRGLAPPGRVPPVRQTPANRDRGLPALRERLARARGERHGDIGPPRRRSAGTRRVAKGRTP